MYSTLRSSNRCKCTLYFTPSTYITCRTLNAVNLSNVPVTDLTEDCEHRDVMEVQESGVIEDVNDIESTMDSGYPPATSCPDNTSLPPIPNSPAPAHINTGDL